MNIKKVCVLGGGGFVGIHIVNKLGMAGYSVRVLTRTREHAKTVAVLPDVEVVEANIFDPAELNRHFAGMDAVINLVGMLNEEKVGRVDKPWRVAAIFMRFTLSCRARLCMLAPQAA